MKQRILSILLSLCMVLCFIPAGVLAEGETVKTVAAAQELIDALADSAYDIVRLVNDIEITGTMRISKGREVILDLNGYVLDLGGNKIYVNDASLASKLTIIDSRPDEPHGFTPNTDGLWVRDEANGTKAVKGGVITGGHSDASDYCGGIDIGRNGTVIMKAGHIVGGYADSNGGGVHLASGGIFTMNGGSITGCKAGSMGGGVHMSSGTFTMNGGSITDCTARDGGGVFVSGGAFTLNNGTIQGCTANEVNGDGGGVYLEGGSQFTMAGGSITGCKAQNGGGVFMGGGTMSAGGGTVDGTVVVSVAYDYSSGSWISGVIQSAAGSTGATLFKQDVTNSGEIRYGTFSGKVTVGDSNIPGTICGGTFNGPVNMAGDTTDNEIKGGIFNGTVTIDRGQITGGVFNGEVVVEETAGVPAPVLAGGTYNGLIKNNSTTARFVGAHSPLGIVGKEPYTQSRPYHKVTFDPNSGTMDYTVRYFCDEKHISDKIKPNDRAGYTFGGWYKADGTAWDHANDKVTGDMTLTAKWTECDHSGHTGQQPTCTDSVTCTACGGTIAALGHDWSPWAGNSDNTHTHSCLRVGCGYTETFGCADGNNDHTCDDCGKVISNHEDVDKNHVCDYCGKVVSNHTGGTATCADKAVCEICGDIYGELDVKNHANLTHYSAKEATKEADGNIEYWYCDGCDKYYSDAAAAKEITKAGTVTVKLPDNPKNPQTGDNNSLILWVALLFISGGAVIGTAITSGKKKRNS